VAAHHLTSVISGHHLVIIEPVLQLLHSFNWVWLRGWRWGGAVAKVERTANVAQVWHAESIVEETASEVAITDNSGL